MSEDQDAPETAVAAQDRQPEPTPANEPEAPVAAQEPQPEAMPAGEPEAPVAAQDRRPEPTPANEPEAPVAPPAPAEPSSAERSADGPQVGPKILGVAEEKPLPVVKQRLQEKPRREPLPWPELRAAVAATREDLGVAELKELFRIFPGKVRDEVTENVRGFRKGARRPVSQHAAKQLARAVHTARRMKRNAAPSRDVSEALGQAMAAELIASLEPERAAEVILPKRDLLEREARTARRRAKDDEDKRRDEQRRRRREDAKSSRQQTSFGTFSGAKIQGLDEIAAMFQDEPAPAEAQRARTAEDAAGETAPAETATEPAPVEDAPAETAPAETATEPAPVEDAPAAETAAEPAPPAEGDAESETKP